MSDHRFDTKISVVMSVYNDEQNVAESVNSILNQSYSNFEFLIMDDGSSDNTNEIIFQFKDPRIKIFENKTNIGLTKSLNKLIKFSTGKIIARQDSDDLSVLTRFEKQFKFLKSKNLHICTTRALIKGTNISIPKYSHYFPVNHVMKFKNPFIHGTLFMYKNVIEDIGLYDENYEFAQDYKLFSSLINSGFKIGIMNDRLYILNTKNNISTNKANMQKYYFEKAKKEYKTNNSIW